jgi:hypothetical protein
VAWIVKLVKTGVGGEEQCVDVMQINPCADAKKLDTRKKIGAPASFIQGGSAAGRC